MKRREFISLFGGVAAAWPLAARAQQPAVPTIAYLGSSNPKDDDFRVNAFREGLSAAGYVEGRTVAIDYFWSEDRYDRIPALVMEITRRKPILIAAMGTSAAGKAVKTAGISIPTVFLTGGDPVAHGLVPNLNHPGGNLTGVSILVNTTVPKQVELLREALPKAATVGLLINPQNPNVPFDVERAQQATNVLGLRLLAAEATTENELETAVASLVQQGAEGFFAATDQFLTNHRMQIVALAAAHRFPGSYYWREFVTIGGLMSYGTDFASAYRQCGTYAARILNGEKPGDLPVLQVTKMELVINLKTAKTLGISFPLSLLGRADEAIE